MTHDEILADVANMIADVVGPDFLLDVEVTADTTFNADLALESIEFVALAEKLQDRYDGRVDFVAFVADMDIDEIMSMSVGRLVGHVERCLAGSDLMHGTAAT
jgi:acyl carrier protein